VRRLPLELAAVWILFAVVASELTVTYARLDARELYNVSGSGLEGGTSRLLVFLNYPVALVAIAVLLLLVANLDSALRVTAVVGVVLCAAVFWPDVVNPDDLDARPVNAVAGCGVAVAVALTVLVWRRAGRERTLDRTAAPLRLTVAVAAFLIAVPWMAAESGVSFNGVPVLGTVWQTGELRTAPGERTPHVAVHHGHHHGMDGTLLVWTALLLLPLAARLSTRGLRLLTTAYLALMLTYGAALVANDAWLEQVVGRGWTNREIPSPIEPSATPIWGAIVAATAILFAVLAVRRGRRSGAGR